MTEILLIIEHLTGEKKKEDMKKRGRYQGKLEPGGQ